MDETMEQNAGVTGTINFSMGDPTSAADLTDHVHLLPCSIKHDGSSSVSAYFKPRDTGVNVDGLSVKEAFFRGRRLQGVTMPIPKGYRGFVLDKKKVNKRKKGESSGEHLNQWEARAEFGNITYWNHDTLPSADDPLLRCFHLFQVADALHKPLTAEELVSSSAICSDLN